MCPSFSPVSSSSDEEFRGDLNDGFTPGELEIIDSIILGQQNEGGYVVGGIRQINSFYQNGAEVSLSRELLEILSLVSQTGSRVLKCMLDGEYVEIGISLPSETDSVDTDVQQTRNQIIFTIGKNDGLLAKLSRGKIKNDSANKIDSLELSVDGCYLTFGSAKTIKMRTRPRVTGNARTVMNEDGVPYYNIKQQSGLHQYFLRFKETYQKAAKKLGLIK